MLIRFPLTITNQEPPKPASWTKTLGQTLIVVLIIAFLIYVFVPMLREG